MISQVSAIKSFSASFWRRWIDFLMLKKDNRLILKNSGTCWLKDDLSEIAQGTFALIFLSWKRSLYINFVLVWVCVICRRSFLLNGTLTWIPTESPRSTAGGSKLRVMSLWDKELEVQCISGSGILVIFESIFLFFSGKEMVWICGKFLNKEMQKVDL